MNRRFAHLGLLAVFCLGLFACICISGCETVKGMGRDIRNGDDWIRDHLW